MPAVLPPYPSPAAFENILPDPDPDPEQTRNFLLLAGKVKNRSRDTSTHTGKPARKFL
ncbi:GL21561 [Drosophila persimilis]|uniref:GL21561 n=1 Tax=Drosophila persimilis TaxID=7234 RepID=B4IRE9_DROPE|nr:GL21561 [Drosophila persimilis]